MAGMACTVVLQLAARGVPDDSIGTLTQFLGHVIPLVDDKLLVEDLFGGQPWCLDRSRRLRYLEDLAVGEVAHCGWQRRGSFGRGERAVVGGEREGASRAGSKSPQHRQDKARQGKARQGRTGQRATLKGERRKAKRGRAVMTDHG